MRTTQSWLTLFTVSSIAAAAEPAKPSPELTDPKAIMNRAIEAMTRTKTIAYKADYAATGWLTEFIPTIQGTVLAGKDSDLKVDRLRFTVKVKKSDSEEVEELSAGADGDRFYVINPKTKTVHADIDPGVLGKHSWHFSLVRVPAFGNPAKFVDELKQGSVDLIEGKSVGGEDCYGLLVKMQNPAESHWFVSKKDFLPRQVSEIYVGGPKNESASSTLTLNELAIEPKTPNDPFAITVPDGFKKTDEFAE